MRSAQQHVARRDRRTWPQRSVIVLGCLLTVTCVVAASSLGYLYWKTGRFQRGSLTLDSAGSNEPRNYLIIGSDSRDAVDPDDPSAGVLLGPGEPAGKRSDTILVVRIDPGAGTAKMLSFPR